MANSNPTPAWRNGRWIIQIQKNKVRHTFTSSIEGRKGKKECLDKYYVWLDGGADGKKTLNKVYTEYIEDVRARRGESSSALISYKSYYDNYIPKQLKGMKMCNITAQQWQGVLNTAKKKNGEYLSATSLKCLKVFISSLIHFGYEDYQCELPRKRLYIPQNRVDKKEREILSFEQMQRLFEPSNLFYHKGICFMALYGLRPSEVLGLKISDLNGNVLTIQRGITQKNKITKGKTSNAHRKIYLGELGMNIINETIERNKRLKLHTDYIFCSKEGCVGNQSGMRKNYLELKEERDLCGTLYSMRHSFISYFATSGDLDEKTLKLTVGHSDKMPTFDTYAHFVEENAKKNSAIIDDTFMKILQSATKVHQTKLKKPEKY